MKLATIKRLAALAYLRCNLSTYLDDEDAASAKQEGQKAVEIVGRVIGEDVVGEGGSLYRAKGYQLMGEIEQDQKKEEEAEKWYLKAVAEATAYAADTHTCLIQFHGNLIDLYGSSENEEKKAKCLELAKKNNDIATSNFGELNIYTIKTELDMVTNMIMQFQDS